MNKRATRLSVVDFYDTHPINEEQIRYDLKRDGIALEGLTEDKLQHYDQDHFGGLAATDLLAEKAGITASTHVLDVCSGLGGPARYLANRLGCRVTGLDFTQSRHESAVRLTKRVGLDHRVGFRHGDALDMPFADGGFDVVISQEAFAHIPDKPRLIGECVRVLKTGGTVAFTDIVRRPNIEQAALERLQQTMVMPELTSLDDYRELLEQNGCNVLCCEDLSGFWAEILVKRLEMYRGLKETTISRFGADHFERWDGTYAFFVGLFARGQLGGGRLVARRAA